MSTAGFLPSIGQSFAIIFLSEIADRTFILIAIYALKLNWFPILITSLLSLGIMNLLAVYVGYLVPLLLVKGLVDWIGFACFTLFGIYSIYDSCTMEEETVEQAMLNHQEEEAKKYNALADSENVVAPEEKGTLGKCLELFWLLAISEVGDKSEITTIAIAALYDFYGVLCGTMLAYTCTILIATCLGHILAKYITEKQMSFWGGIIFLLFSLQILLVKLGVLSS